jgi:hypothetical protein
MRIKTYIDINGWEEEENKLRNCMILYGARMFSLIGQIQ